MSSLAITNGTILTGRADEPWITGGHVVVRDGVITSVGAGGAPDPVDEVIDAAGMIVSPGFANAHTHLCMSLGRTLGVDASLLEWLSEHQLPLMSVFEPEDYALAVQLGALENLKAGNTTVSEVFFSNRLADGADELALQALEAFGLRTMFYRCSNDLAFAPGFQEDLADIDRRSAQLRRAVAHPARTQVGVGPLVPWAATPDYWAQTRSLADAGVPVHLHTAETPEYNALVHDAVGMSNVGMLADVGVLGPNTVLNHCVHVSEDDVRLIAEHGSPVVHDPTSNMFLASGISPVVAMRNAGIVLGLACDGPACNNTQDMFEVMKDAALLHKVSARDPRALTAADVFEMATVGGARANGLGETTGRLAPGYEADIVLIDANKPHLTPLHDPLAATVYSARAADVDTVLVQGNVVLRNGQVPGFDEERFLARVRERGAQLLRLATD